MKRTILTLFLLGVFPLSAAISDLDKKFNIKRSRPTVTSSPKRPAAQSAPKSGSKRAQQKKEAGKKAPVTPAEPTHIVLDTGYNGAQVKLPVWYWKRTQKLHEKLKEKLSPADYSEILQGEYYLFNGGKYNFGTKKDIAKDPLPVIKKLEAILADPSDVVFPRCRFVESEHEGVFFRENVMRCRQYVDWADERCVVTHTAGLSAGCSSSYSFWDTRTFEKIAELTTPRSFDEVEKKENAYILTSNHGEEAARWFDRAYGDRDILMIDPFSYSFQTLYAAYGNSSRLNKYQNLDRDIKKGDLYEKLKNDIEWEKEEVEGVTYQLASYLCNPENSPRTYVRPLATGEIAFYRDGNDGLSIDFDRLSASIEEASLRSYIQSVPEELFSNEEYYSYGWHAFVSEQNAGWKFFYVFHSLHEVAWDTVAVSGILSQEGKVYFFPGSGESDTFPIELSGSLYKYDKKRDAYKLENDWLFDGKAPFRRCWSSYMDLLQVKPISSRELEIVIGGEMTASKAGIQRIKLDVSTMQYQTIAKWEFPLRTLMPTWQSSKKWLFRPGLDNGYSIIHAPASGSEEKIADLYLFEDNGFALVLPNGHFAGSPGCEKVLGCAKDGKEIGMDALSPWRNRPAEVLNALGGKEDDIAALRETTRRWLGKQGYDIEKMPPEPDINAVPEVEVNLPDLHQEKKTLEVDVVVRAKNAAVRQLLVRADGQLDPQEKDISVAAHGEEKVTVSVPLATGQNWIELTAVDEQGLVGATQRFRVIHESALTSDLYVICLGVCEYEKPELRLQYAAKDAKDVAEAFQKQPGKVRTLTLTDSEFRDTSALEEIRGFLSATTIDDRVIMYCAGHGMLDERLNYYFAPAAFDPEDIAGTGIAMEQLTACMAKAPARKKLLLLDTCHAGILGEEDEEKLALAGIRLPHGVRAIAQRGMKAKQVQTGLSAKQTKRFIEELFSHNDGTRGMNIITASAGSEFALESDQWQNGIFAAAIVKALTSELFSADKNSNDQLNCGELRDYVARQVSILSAGKQRTVVNCSENTSDFEVLTTKWKENLAENLKTLDLLMKLIQNGGDVNTKVDGVTALHLAAATKNVGAIEELLRKGADPNCYSEGVHGDQETPFHIACQRNCVKGVEEMLFYNANVNAKTKLGKSPLQMVKDEKLAKRICEIVEMRGGTIESSVQKN